MQNVDNNVDNVENLEVWSLVIANSAIVDYANQNKPKSRYNNIRQNATNIQIVDLCNTINQLQTEEINTITRRTVKELIIM